MYVFVFNTVRGHWTAKRPQERPGAMGCVPGSAQTWPYYHSSRPRNAGYVFTVHCTVYTLRRFTYVLSTLTGTTTPKGHGATCKWSQGRTYPCKAQTCPCHHSLLLCQVVLYSKSYENASRPRKRQMATKWPLIRTFLVQRRHGRVIILIHQGIAGYVYTIVFKANPEFDIFWVLELLYVQEVLPINMYCILWKL